jgi:heme A synthase
MMTLATTRRLLTCGAIGGPLFIVAFLVEGATRAGYDPVRHPVSSLALGDLGWTQAANFVVTGLLMLAFAAGLRPALLPGRGARWVPLLVGAYAIGLIGAGIFVTDPVNGYPPGTSDKVAASTVGTLHDLFSLPVFVALPIACFVLARRFSGTRRIGWAVYSIITPVLFLATFFLASLGFSGAEGWVEVGGMYQRVSITIGWGYLSLLALHLLREGTADRRADPPAVTR